MLVKNNKETTMKFKSVAAALLAAVTCVSMAACGSGSDTNADGKVEITMWHNSTTGDGKAYWESAAKAFEKENPNVTIKIEAIQNEDMDGKLQTALQDPNSAPDIFMARGGQKLRDVVEAGQAMDLTDKISDTVKNQMATAEATGTIDGKIYSVQQSVLPGGIWYSKDLFEKAGITETPKTWDEFKTVVQKLKDAGITPIAVGGKDAWPAAHWWYWFALRECSADTFDKAQSDKDFSDKCWTRTGDDVQALLDPQRDGKMPHGEIVLVVSSRAGAYALTRAENAGVAARVLTPSCGQEPFENELSVLLREQEIDLILLAGFTVILSAEFTKQWPRRILNVHPSLIPAFCGKGMYGLRVHEAALARGVKVTGATVHFVNEIPDGGEILLQKAVEIAPDDTPETLQRRVMEQAEWQLLPLAAERVCAEIVREKEQKND